MAQIVDKRPSSIQPLVGLAVTSVILLLNSQVFAQPNNQNQATEAVPTISVDLTPLGNGTASKGTVAAVAAPGSPLKTAAHSELAVEYRCAEVIANTNQVKPHLRIENHGSNEIPLSEMTVRYWFRASDNESYKMWCDWAQVGANNVQGKFVRLNAPRRGADSYLEISFEPATGKIAPQSGSGEFQIRFSNQSWSNFDQGSDYSFNAAQTQYAESSHITLYRRGKLVWGTEPSK